MTTKVFFSTHRKQIYGAIIVLLLSAYMVSFALMSITTFVLLLFFFLDSKANLKLKWQHIKSNKIIVLYMLYFICQCIGLIYSSNIGYGLKRVNTLLPILFLPSIVYTEKIDKVFFYKGIEFLRWFVVLVFSGFLIIHVFVEERGLNIFSLLVLKEKLGISQFYMVFILIIPILFTLNELLKNQRQLLNGFLLVLLLFFVLLLSNKTAVLMMFFLFTIKLINVIRGKSLFFKASVFVFIPILLGMLVYNTQGVKQKFEVLLKTTDFDIEVIKTKNKVTYTKNTLEHRMLINYLSAEVILKKFPFGVGTGDYQDVLNKKYQDVHFKLGIKEMFNSHNQYISEFLKTGILGGVMFITLLVYLFKSAEIKNQYYFVLLLLFSIGCCFESYLDRQHGVVIFAFILPLFQRFDANKKLYYE